MAERARERPGGGHSGVPVETLPLQEIVESAAARVRPLILNDDPTFYGKFMQATGYLISTNDAPEEMKKHHLALKKAWNAI
jgi:hypothetical protein